jgi:hypothetical protein
MVKVRCQVCTATAEADSFEDAKAKLDHATGRSKGRPCAGGPSAPVIVDGPVKKGVRSEPEPAKSRKSRKDD